jgi:methionyl aminopeptidase
MKIDAKELEKWRKAGKLGREVLEYAKTLTKPDVPLIEIAEKIDKKISQLKVKSAFPVNLSIDEQAAHCTPTQRSEDKSSGLLKIDLGISIDGYISDLACSVDLSPDKKYEKLIQASEEALKNAIKIIRPGITLGRIGKEIQDTIENLGFLPIVNLSGHELQKYNLHAGLTIPNFDNKSDVEIEEGMILAIEPFATTGTGAIRDGRPSGIYKFLGVMSVRDNKAREILNYIQEEFKELPFCSRWIEKKFGVGSLFALSSLEKANALHHFKQLIEKSKMPVSQAEATVLVTRNGCEVLTEKSAKEINF